MHEATLGLLMILVAGAMNGSFAVPMKLTHRWTWEHTWLMWTIYGLFIFPPLLTFITIPDTHGSVSRSRAGRCSCCRGVRRGMGNFGGIYWPGGRSCRRRAIFFDHAGTFRSTRQPGAAGVPSFGQDRDSRRA